MSAMALKKELLFWKHLMWFTVAGRVAYASFIATHNSNTTWALELVNISTVALLYLLIYFSFEPTLLGWYSIKRKKGEKEELTERYFLHRTPYSLNRLSSSKIKHVLFMSFQSISIHEAGTFQSVQSPSRLYSTVMDKGKHNLGLFLNCSLCDMAKNA